VQTLIQVAARVRNHTCPKESLQLIILDSEVNFGEVAFPQRRTKKKQALYQGTASAVPERDDPDGLLAPGQQTGAKALRMRAVGGTAQAVP
jgi:hypothetical protein